VLLMLIAIFCRQAGEGSNTLSSDLGEDRIRSRAANAYLVVETRSSIPLLFVKWRAKGQIGLSA
jgi:hypothetical protein